MAGPAVVLFFFISDSGRPSRRHGKGQRKSIDETKKNKKNPRRTRVVRKSTTTKSDRDRDGRWRHSLVETPTASFLMEGGRTVKRATAEQKKN